MNLRKIVAAPQMGVINRKDSLHKYFPLPKVVKFNWVDKLNEHIAAKSDLNVKDEDGKTPLHIAVEYAVEYNNLVLQILIEAKADLNLQDKYGKTPLHRAVECMGLYSPLKILIEAKADLNLQDKYGKTPLHRAVEYKNLIALEELINAGADLSVKDNLGYTALHYAVDYKNIYALNVFINAEVDLNLQDKDGNTAVHCAVLKIKLAKYFNRDKALMYLKMLIQAKADLNLQDKDGYTAVHCAVEYKNLNSLNALKALIEGKADLNLRDSLGRTAVLITVQNVYCAKSKTVLKYLNTLIEAKADLNIPSNAPDLITPLHAAVNGFGKDIKVLKALINKANATIDKRSKEGFTPLHLATLYRNFEAIKVLVKTGARLDIESKSGNTALDFARTSNKIIKFLKKSAKKREESAKRREENGYEETLSLLQPH